MSTVSNPLLAETVVSINTIAARAPNGRGPGSTRSAHRTTVLRWIIRGVSVRGVRVKLEALRVGGRWVTSLEAYGRFVETCGGIAGLASQGERPRTSVQAKRDADHAIKLREAIFKRAK